MNRRKIASVALAALLFSILVTAASCEHNYVDSFSDNYGSHSNTLEQGFFDGGYDTLTEEDVAGVFRLDLNETFSDVTTDRANEELCIRMGDINDIAEIQQYITSNGTLIDDFETVGDWVLGGSGASREADTTYFLEGTQSINLTGTGGNAAFMTKTISMNFSLATNFAFWVYVHDLSSLNNIAIYIASQSNFASFFLTTISYANFREGWNRVTLSKSHFTAYGGEDWNNVMVRLRLRQNLQSGQDGSLSFDHMTYSLTATKPKCVIAFDDGWDSTYTEALPIMTDNSQVGTVFFIANFEGTGSWLDLSELTALNASGWDISSHGYNSLDLDESDISPEELDEELNDSFEWLVDNGFAHSARYLAYPYGGYNDTVIEATKENYVAARTIINGEVQALPMFDVSNITYTFKTNLVYNTTSTATVQDWIDETIDQNGLLILTFHRLVDSDPDYKTYYLISDFEIISDYLASRSADIDVIPFSDLVSAEELVVEWYDSSSSSWVDAGYGALTANRWNNVTIALDSFYFTIRFIDSSQSTDGTQSSWQKDCILLHTWGAVAAASSGGMLIVGVIIGCIFGFGGLLLYGSRRRKLE